MNNKERKKIQLQYAQKNIDFFFNLLDSRFKPEFDSTYIKEIKKISQGFNIRLTRDEKLKFCKKCNSYLDVNSREIRLNSTLGAKEFICKNCGDTRRFKYK